MALIVSLVTGAAIPPLRLDVLKKLDILSEDPICSDPDCLFSTCKGNHVQVNEIDDSKELMLHIVHGKNDRRPTKELYQICFKIPKGDLHNLWMTHMFEGRPLLTLSHGNPSHKVSHYIQFLTCMYLYLYIYIYIYIYIYL